MTPFMLTQIIVKYTLNTTLRNASLILDVLPDSFNAADINLRSLYKIKLQERTFLCTGCRKNSLYNISTCTYVLTKSLLLIGSMPADFSVLLFSLVPVALTFFLLK